MKAKIIIGVCGALLQLSAHAASITQTAIINNASLPATASEDRNLLFSGLSMFDSTLGVLESVELGFDVTYNTQFTITGVQVVDETLSHSLTSDALFMLNLGFPYSSSVGFDPDFLVANSGFNSCSGEAFSPACTDTSFFNLSDQVSQQKLYTSNLDFYTGTGDRYLFLTLFATDLSFGGEFGDQYNNVYFGNAGLDGFTNLSATVNLTYNYTPSPVPVPASIFLFGSGLTGFIVAARKKRSYKHRAA